MARVLTRPTDAASAAAFRVLFGLVMFVASTRYLVNGWVERFFVEPSTHLKYWGFGWVQVLPPEVMHGAFVALAVLSLMVAAGLFYRFAIAAFFLLFTYVELIDASYYLNHYYLVSLLAGLMIVLPLNRAWSLDALRRPEIRSGTLPAWVLWLLRFQVATVYAYAAIAKVGPDWLLHGQPLGIWLAARTDTPIIGPWLDLPGVALALSWAGFLNDALAVPGLLWRRTRPYAFAMIVVFHVMTGVFFNIGMFPVIMITAATVLLSPSWPRTLLRRLGVDARAPVPGEAPLSSPSRRFRVGLALAAAFCAVQLLVPLRSLAYPGDVLWGEQGMRWSWKVMVREKNGSVTYHVRDPRTDRRWQVSPGEYLTRTQQREMSGQPDLILQLAHRIEDDFRERGHDDVEVRAETRVSLNGRRAQPLVDPEVDLTRVDDGLAAAGWLAPPPEGPPAKLERPHLATGGAGKR
ncbi:MAG: HTTM domain-containing protein [Polyangiales bacterium]